MLRIRIAALALLLLVFATLGTGCQLLSKQSAAETADSFVEAAMEGDSEALDKLMHDSLKSGALPDVARTLLGAEMVTGFVAESESEGQAIVALPDSPSQQRITLVLVDGKWKVQQVEYTETTQYEESYTDSKEMDSELLAKGESLTFPGKEGLRTLRQSDHFVNGQFADSSDEVVSIETTALAELTVRGTGNPAESTDGGWRVKALSPRGDSGVEQDDPITLELMGERGSMVAGTYITSIYGNEKTMAGRAVQPYLILPTGEIIPGEPQTISAEWAGTPPESILDRSGWSIGLAGTTWDWNPQGAELDATEYLGSAGDTWLPGMYAFVVTLDGDAWKYATVVVK